MNPSAPLHPRIAEITARIDARSAQTRQAYLERIARGALSRVHRGALSCTNLAHAVAAMPGDARTRLIDIREVAPPNLAIVSSYNDMLSAHAPLQAFPDWIKRAAQEAGASAQFAGGVPAMCDGVTQGQPGMELSLFSRDVIAMATAIALSHQMFDAALYLGVCDKIVPGLLIGALAFGHLPALLVPAGPMSSGLPNDEKARIRQLYAKGEVGREQLLDAEMRAYHGAGTCTFYGTANSNQLLMDVMGLHLPGSAFVPPDTQLRRLLTMEATRRAVRLARGEGEGAAPIGELFDARVLVNGIVALLATGGSTNHTLHLVAIGRAAGLAVDWSDFDELSRVVPLLARIYPNGSADVNHFHAAGGTPFLIRELLGAGLLHADVATVNGRGLACQAQEPWDDDGRLRWRAPPPRSLDSSVLRGVDDPFTPDGGLRLLHGNLGRAVIKVSAVKTEHRVVAAPARVFDDQDALLQAFMRGELEHDFVAVIRFQGPRANGMPELHKLTPTLAVLQDRGLRVALVTDGRMSGASGKVPAAIHVTPEAACGGALARVRDGDMVLVDAERGVLQVEVDAAQWDSREPARPQPGRSQQGIGRELFEVFRRNADGAEQGASSFLLPDWNPS